MRTVYGPRPDVELTDAERAVAPKRVVGYAEPWAVRAGEELTAMVSAPGAFEASVVRLDGQERHVPVASTIEGRHEGGVQPLRLGSHVVVAPAPALGASFSVQAWIQPTWLRGEGPQALVAAGEGSGFVLLLEADGRLALATAGLERRLVHPRPLTQGAWHFVAASVDGERDELRLWVAELDRAAPELHEAAGAGAAGLRPDGAGALLLAAAPIEQAGAEPLAGARVEEPRAAARAAHHFTGRIDTPRVFDGPLSPEIVAQLLAGPVPDSAPPLAGAWRLGPGREIEDVSGHGARAEAVNHPARAVTGWNWTGEEIDPRLVPEQYGALHFHADDLTDACWQPSLRLTVPDEWKSGVYAVRVECDGEVDHVPFFVEPDPGAASADVLLLVPTFSYLAYGNESNSWIGLPPDERPPLGPADRYVHEQRLLSLYERHLDGSGVMLSSRRRPIANMRPENVAGLLGCAHQFPADLQLVQWLRTRGTAFDVLTDESLHREGPARLAEYRVVILATHPEYVSGEILRALETFLDGGGRLMYLGGNGAYWVTSCDPDEPWMVEVRRGHAGTRPWDSEPGEQHHATTGELGGLWRHRGWAPQRLFGVGTSGEGDVDGIPYTFGEGARDPRVAFAVEGIDLDRPLGERGLVLGTAASFEVDRHEPALGSSPASVVLASAVDIPDYCANHEEVEFGPEQARSDVVFTPWPGEGAAFGVGSIGWCGALLIDAGENDVSRLTGNVLDAFRAGATPWR